MLTCCGSLRTTHLHSDITFLLVFLLHFSEWIFTFAFKQQFIICSSLFPSLVLSPSTVLNVGFLIYVNVMSAGNVSLRVKVSYNTGQSLVQSTSILILALLFPPHVFSTTAVSVATLEHCCFSKAIKIPLSGDRDEGEATFYLWLKMEI